MPEIRHISISNLVELIIEKVGQTVAMSNRIIPVKFEANPTVRYRVITFLADRTATQYDRLLPAGFCPSVCPSVCNAVHCGSHGWCTRLKVIPACS